MAIWPWYGVLTTGKLYDAAEFLAAQEYENVVRWYEEIAARDAVIRGRKVNRINGPLEDQLRERHDASDFARRTQDRPRSGELEPCPTGWSRIRLSDVCVFACRAA